MSGTLQASYIKDGSSSSNNIALDSSGNVAVAGNVNAGGTISSPYNITFRNRIINGAMEIAQRGTSLSTGTGVLTYTLDRWIVAANTAALTAAQGTQTAFPYNYLYLTGAASNSLFTIRQRIEAKNIRDLANGTVTLSFYFYNTTGNATNLQVALYYPSAEDNFTTTTLISQTTLASTTNTARQSVTFSLPDNAKNGVEVIFTGTALTSGIVVLHTVQLEPGFIPTVFERRPYGVEYALCQRYYYKYAVGIGITVTANSAGGSLFYPVTMRATPTISNGSFVANTGSNGTFSPINSSNYGFSPYNSAGNWTVGTGVTAYFEASAEL
jgi:hypothetical protein